jgi:hypothetical protein
MRCSLAHAVALAASTAVAAGCGALASELHTAEVRYDEARYDEALVWLGDLEDDLPDMDADEQARFYFLRGMTAYRVGDRDEALHYLALAREVTEGTDAALPEAWQPQLVSTLDELMPDSATFHARPEASAEEAFVADEAAPAEPAPDAASVANEGATSPAP